LTRSMSDIQTFVEGSRLINCADNSE
jgi:hypothetical protein